MEYLPNGCCLDIPPGCFPLSTDSMVLADFVRLPRNARVLDLGAGCGTLGLLLCAGDQGCHVSGIELDPDAHAAALANIRANALETRMESICADLRQLPGKLAPGGFDLCVSNPPYFSGGFASRTAALARQTGCCSTEELCSAAAFALKYGGDFYVVHKPENLAHLIACAAAKGMAAKRLLLVRHRPDAAVSLIALQFRKGGKPGLKIEEAALFHADGSPTEYYRRVYHITAPHGNAL